MFKFTLTASCCMFAWACTDDANGGSDGGVAEDRGSESYDAGTLDAALGEDLGVRDVGRRDAGFSDPLVRRAGVEEVAGLRMYFAIYGTQTGTMAPVIVVPRGPGHSHEYWLPYVKDVLPNRQFVLYDQRATGQTSFGDGSATSTITAFRNAEDLKNLVEYLDGLPEISTQRVDILGHGYGAGVALLFAAAHPDKVGHLVLVDPYPADIRQHANYQAEIEARITDAERILYHSILERAECRGVDNACYLELWRIVGPHFMCPSTADRFSMLTFRYGSLRADRFIDQDLRSIRYDWRNAMRQVRAKTTVIATPCSPTPVATSTTYSGNVPGANIVTITNSGHFPMVEAAASFGAEVRAALSR